MSFFDSLHRAAEGIRQDGQYNEDHVCARDSHRRIEPRDRIDNGSVVGWTG